MDPMFLRERCEEVSRRRKGRVVVEESEEIDEDERQSLLTRGRGKLVIFHSLSARSVAPHRSSLLSLLLRKFDRNDADEKGEERRDSRGE